MMTMPTISRRAPAAGTRVAPTPLAGGARRAALAAAPPAPRARRAAAGRRARAAPARAAARAVAAAAATPLPGVRVVDCDFLVLGSGIAGLSYALRVADAGRVCVVTKAAAAEGATAYAQGGVCAVLDPLDSVAAHAADTLAAGAYLGDPAVVEMVCREAPRLVLDLAERGARFSREAGGAGARLHLTREGGHSARRVVHAADATGAEVERALLAAARAHPNVTFHEHQLAVDLLVAPEEGAPARPAAAGAAPPPGPRRRALGADAVCTRTLALTRFVAPVTLLATGGAGQAYPRTTNPGVATGDGVAMAARARAAVANMEFVQFHPTALAAPPARGDGGRAFLLSEALRGEGARLLSAATGERFMARYDAARLELAPRDVVARAIHAEMSAPGAPQHVLLDISHRPRAEVLAHFPTIAARLAAAGLDLAGGPVPVAPAAHYMCGGVATGAHGETSVAGLYAAGEVACTGLHGANRLASNSLLEGLVFADRAAAASAAALAAGGAPSRAELAAAAAAAPGAARRAPARLPPAAAARCAARRAELRALVWSGAGIVRSVAGMRAAQRGIAGLYAEAAELLDAHGPAPAAVELRNLVTVGELIVSSALRRRESRGGHYCEDFPEEDALLARPTVLAGSGAGGVSAARAARRRGARAPPPFTLSLAGPAGARAAAERVREREPAPTRAAEE